MYLFVSLFVNLHFLSSNLLALNIFSSRFQFKLCENSLGRAVDKFLTNGSRVNSHGQLIIGKQSLSLFRGNAAFQQNRRCNFSHFLDMVKTGLFFTFFVKVNG